MRIDAEGWGSSLMSSRGCTRGRIRLQDSAGSRRAAALSSSRALLRSFANGVEDLGDLTVQQRKIKIQNRSTRMKNDIERAFEQSDIATHGFTHSALDSIAIDRLSHHLAHGKADTRTGRLVSKAAHCEVRRSSICRENCLRLD